MHIVHNLSNSAGFFFTAEFLRIRFQCFHDPAFCWLPKPKPGGVLWEQLIGGHTLMSWGKAESWMKWDIEVTQGESQHTPAWSHAKLLESPTLMDILSIHVSPAVSLSRSLSRACSVFWVWWMQSESINLFPRWIPDKIYKDKLNKLLMGWPISLSAFLCRSEGLCRSFCLT